MEVLVPFITIKSYAFLNCKNLQKMNLSESSVYCLEEGSFGNCYNLEYVILSKKTKNIHVMIRSEIRFISRELVEKALLPCVLSNFNLLENRYTEDGLLPIQVYIEVMFFRDHRPNTSDKLLENLFLFLKEGPSTISLLL